ncbi:Oidioi.mRNA.OKI2018_I69.XSR.g13897.t1.cds [Oikopleura dioica]|nr:Oidioi.mRNA.OKI2018_I69.XSR.g13897.t1.cds [Oikopleura dioica]
MLKQLLIDGLKGRSKDELSVLHNESEEEASRLFEELCAEKDDVDLATRESYLTIPRFHKALPKENEVVKHKLREEARALFLQRKSNALMDNEELQKLWFLLEENKTENVMSDDHLISYRNFKAVGSKCSQKSQSFFTAKTFFKIYTGDKSGQISIMQFFNYVMRKVWLQQTRIGLSLYDVSGRGFLREMDLENYILELIPTLPQLQGLEKTFYSFYVCTAVRKFFFFLDPLKTNR